MIKIKQIKLELICLGVFVLLALACKNIKSDKDKTRFEYGEVWDNGKKLFYSNCAQCHIPRNKDEIFKEYMIKQSGLLLIDKLGGLQKNISRLKSY